MARMVEYLKTENRILRNKLPKRVQVTPAERSRLLKVGRPLGSAIRELITIVSPRTSARWTSGESSKGKRRTPGRPRKPEEIRQLIVHMGEGTGLGSKRILGEIRRLGIRKISGSTVARILREHGFDPGP